MATEEYADVFVGQIARDWKTADLDPLNHALCTYAEKLTLSPTEMTETDITILRDVGLDDRTIHDATQVIGYFNYINRVADALDVPLESFVRSWEEG